MDRQKKIPLVPSRLVSGDTIGIVAPASPFEREKFDRGLAAIQSMGYRLAVPRDLFIKNGYLAGSDNHRASSVNRFFADKTVKAIICAKGGFGSLKILSLLDYEAVRQNPKIFVGFSDISALLATLYTKCGLITFHGPMLTTLADSDRKTKDTMISVLSSDHPLEITPRKGITIKPGCATGPVLAGNLTTLCHLIGTLYAPSLHGHILLLEERGEPPYRLDRMLTHMKLAGCFKGLAGLALGSFEDCGSYKGIYRIIENIFNLESIPILGGLDVGHGRRNLMVPIGIEATLDADRQELTFQRPATSSSI
jgi:muramoyltetrapeptide carboxypeptidase